MNEALVGETDGLPPSMGPIPAASLLGGRRRPEFNPVKGVLTVTAAVGSARRRRVRDPAHSIDEMCR